MRCQLRATILRAEKYASPGTSKTHAASYRGALDTLASASEALLQCDPSAGPDTAARHIQRHRHQAAALLLDSDASLLHNISAGAPVSDAQQLALDRERRLPVLALQLLPARPAPSAEPGTRCAQCGASQATHHGYICRCLCLCEACAPDGKLLECPVCQEFTEFVRA